MRSPAEPFLIRTRKASCGGLTENGGDLSSHLLVNQPLGPSSSGLSTLTDWLQLAKISTEGSVFDLTCHQRTFVHLKSQPEPLGMLALSALARSCRQLSPKDCGIAGKTRLQARRLFPIVGRLDSLNPKPFSTCTCQASGQDIFNMIHSAFLRMPGISLGCLIIFNKETMANGVQK